MVAKIIFLCLVQNETFPRSPKRVQVILISSSQWIPSTLNATWTAVLKKIQFLCVVPFTKNLSVCYDLWAAHKSLFIELIYQPQFQIPPKALGSWLNAVLNWFPNNEIGRCERSFITQLSFPIQICVHGSCKSHQLLFSPILHFSHFLKKEKNPFLIVFSIRWAL